MRAAMTVMAMVLGLARRRLGADAGGAPPDRRGGGAPGAREQSGHPGRADRSADRGSGRRAGARRLVPDVDEHAPEREHRLAEQQLPLGRRAPRSSDDRLNTNVGVEQTLRWGGRYNVGWDSSRSTTTNIFSNFSPQVRSSLALTYVQPLLRGFSIDTPRQQLLVSAEEPRDRGRHAAADDGHDVEDGPPRVLGPGVRHRLARRAAPVARAGARVAAQHARAHRNRHHAADRPGRSRSRSGAARGSRDPRRRADRHGGGRAARAHLRSVVARLLDAAHRAGGAAALRADAHRRRGGHARRARSPERPPAVTKEPRGRRRQRAFLPQPDAARRHGQLRLRPDRPRRHAVPARRGLPRPDRRPEPNAASAPCSATCSATTFRAGRRR